MVSPLERAIKARGLTEKGRDAVRAEVMLLSLHLGKITCLFSDLQDQCSIHERYEFGT